MEHTPIATSEPTYEERRLRAIRNNKEAKKKKKEAILKAAQLQVTLGDIEYALKKHRGILVRAAQELGTTRSILYRKIRMTPSLERLMKAIQEENLDIAEYRLLQNIDEGNQAAITLYLKTKGKERGYTERSSLEEEVGESVIRSSAALIEAMKKGLVDAPETIDGEYTCVDEQPLLQDQTS